MNQSLTHFITLFHNCGGQASAIFDLNGSFIASTQFGKKTLGIDEFEEGKSLQIQYLLKDDHKSEEFDRFINYPNQSVIIVLTRYLFSPL